MGFELKMLCAYKLTSTVFITNSNPEYIAGHQRLSAVWTTMCGNACARTLLLI